MKSMTIHGLDDPLVKLIQAKARAEGKSLNKTIKALLEESLGVKLTPHYEHKDDFIEFVGVWSETDLHTFSTAMEELREVNKEDWR